MAKKQKNRIVIAGVIILVALALGWLASHYLSPETVDTGTLNIVTHPPGTSVQIDGLEQGLSPKELSLDPGQYIISLHKEHYLPWAETIVITRQQQVELSPILVFMPFVKELVEPAVKNLSWSTDGQDLFYLRPAVNSELVRFSLTKQQEEVLYTHSGRIDATIWVPDYNSALLHLSSYGEGSPISMWQPDNQLAELPIVTIGPSWSNDGEKILYIAGTVDPSKSSPHDIHPAFRFELRESKPDGSEVQQLLDLEETDLAIPIGAAWSPEGTRALIQGEYGVGLLPSLPDAQMIAWLPNAQDTQWSPDGRMIAFRRMNEKGSSLWIADANGRGEAEVAIGVDGPFAWSPDGRIFYFSYSQQENGSALWAVDPETGNLELLADAALLPGLVHESAVSPNGKQIAFVGGDGNLSLLVLRE